MISAIKTKPPLELISFPIILDPVTENGKQSAYFGEEGYLTYYKKSRKISIRTPIREINFDSYEVVLCNSFEYTKNKWIKKILGENLIKDTYLVFKIVTDQSTINIKPRSNDYYVQEFLKLITKGKDVSSYKIDDERYINLAIIVSFFLGALMFILEIPLIAQIGVMFFMIKLTSKYRTKRIKNECFQYSIAKGILPDMGSDTFHLLKGKACVYNEKKLKIMR